MDKMEIREIVESDEREEGEIVDDELEDVSDYSINSPVTPGKSVSSAEHLRAVSLSSISDSDLEENNIRLTYQRHFIPLSKENVRHYSPVPVVVSRYRHIRSKRKCLRKHSRKRRNSSTDSEDEQLDRRTLRQLKEAVHINTSKEIHIHNSLQTRLKCLIEPTSAKSQSEEDDLAKLRTNALESKVTDMNTKTETKECESNVDDKELTELRLEALKSAMLKKHLERKKRRALGDQKEQPVAEVDKENAQDNINTETAEKIHTEENTHNTSMEEDLDIMRAMLLASMSKKIAQVPSVPVSSEPIVPQLITRTISKPKPNAVPTNVKKPVPILSRMIKNNYFSNRVVINNVNPVNNKLMNPKIPTVPPLIIKVNNDSDSDMDIDDTSPSPPPPPPPEDSITKTVTEFLKQQRAEVEAKTQQIDSPDKSVVKLLPISQQMEYHKLKQQLMNAKKRPRIRKFSQTFGNDIKRENVMNKRTVKSKFFLTKFNNARVMKKVDKNGASHLQRTLSDLQVQKDGRLEMKGKYQELAPLLKRVNQISTERKRYENDLKRLLQELEKTKLKLNTAHQSFKCLVEELTRKKEEIDRGSSDSTWKLATSTPHKLVKIQLANDLCKLEESVILSDTSKSQKDVNDSNKNSANECSIEKSDAMRQILDPNDINEIFVVGRPSTVKNGIPEYISPLGSKTCDNATVDPLATFCPFDLLGVCRDKECTYKHCS